MQIFHASIASNKKGSIFSDKPWSIFDKDMLLCGEEQMKLVHYLEKFGTTIVVLINLYVVRFFVTALDGLTYKLRMAKTIESKLATI